MATMGQVQKQASYGIFASGKLAESQREKPSTKTQKSRKETVVVVVTATGVAAQE